MFLFKRPFNYFNYGHSKKLQIQGFLKLQKQSPKLWNTFGYDNNRIKWTYLGKQKTKLKAIFHLGYYLERDFEAKTPILGPASKLGSSRAPNQLTRQIGPGNKETKPK